MLVIVFCYGILPILAVTSCFVPLFFFILGFSLLSFLVLLYVVMNFIYAFFPFPRPFVPISYLAFGARVVAFSDCVLYLDSGCRALACVVTRTWLSHNESQAFPSPCFVAGDYATKTPFLVTFFLKLSCMPSVGTFYLSDAFFYSWPPDFFHNTVSLSRNTRVHGFSRISFAGTSYSCIRLLPLVSWTCLTVLSRGLQCRYYATASAPPFFRLLARLRV